MRDGPLGFEMVLEKGYALVNAPEEPFNYTRWLMESFSDSPPQVLVLDVRDELTRADVEKLREQGNLIVVGGPELFSKWLGESEEAVRHVFKLARELAPSLVFFDPLDALAPVRGRGTGSWTTERVVHQLLAELDDLEKGGAVAVIAATNRCDLVDEALLQPGRFGTLISLALPEAAERKEILALYLNTFRPGAEALDELAAVTDSLSGAQLRALAQFLEREGGANAASWEALYKRWQSHTLRGARTLAPVAELRTREARPD